MFREMMVVGLKVLPLYAAYVIVTSHFFKKALVKVSPDPLAICLTKYYPSVRWWFLFMCGSVAATFVTFGIATIGCIIDLMQVPPSGTSYSLIRRSIFNPNIDETDILKCGLGVFTSVYYYWFLVLPSLFVGVVVLKSATNFLQRLFCPLRPAVIERQLKEADAKIVHLNALLKRQLDIKSKLMRTLHRDFVPAVSTVPIVPHKQSNDAGALKFE